MSDDMHKEIIKKLDDLEDKIKRIDINADVLKDSVSQMSNKITGINEKTSDIQKTVDIIEKK